MKILLLEDDVILNEIITEHLETMGFDVLSTYCGDEAQTLLYEEKFDILILDVNVPNINGFEVLKDLRENKIRTPAIYITSLIGNDDMKKAFESGCDDYIKKPFELSELELRINNVKRLYHLDEKITINFDDKTSYNFKTLEIKNNDSIIRLSKTEAKVLEYLITNKNRTISIEEIQLNNWSYEQMPLDTTIRTYIKNFRKALGKEKIDTIKGLGYILKI